MTSGRKCCVVAAVGLCDNAYESWVGQRASRARGELAIPGSRPAADRPPPSAEWVAPHTPNTAAPWVSSVENLVVSLKVSQTDEFVECGYLHLRGAFPRSLADACRDHLWRAIGCSPDDAGTWTKPVIRIPSMNEPPFGEAANTRALHEAYDALVGPGRWSPLPGLGGFPVRFPHPDDPGDIGWHIDASFPPPDRPDCTDYSEWRLNLWSDGRALLLLFLFSDVAEDDAPTLIRVGSHLLTPPRLEPFGRNGTGTFLDPPGDGLPVSQATGEAGDVYLCHPFLVHSAQRIRGHRPRFLAQPSLPLIEGFDLDGPSAVERAIKRGLIASSG